MIFSALQINEAAVQTSHDNGECVGEISISAGDDGEGMFFVVFACLSAVCKKQDYPKAASLIFLKLSGHG